MDVIITIGCEYNYYTLPVVYTDLYYILYVYTVSREQTYLQMLLLETLRKLCLLYLLEQI